MDMTSIVQALALVLVAAGGTAVVLTRDPLRQAFVASLYGMLLTILFVVLQAPDVAFSELGVGAVAIPALFLFTLARVRNRPQEGKKSPEHR